MAIQEYYAMFSQQQKKKCTINMNRFGFGQKKKKIQNPSSSTIITEFACILRTFFLIKSEHNTTKPHALGCFCMQCPILFVLTPRNTLFHTRLTSGFSTNWGQLHCQENVSRTSCCIRYVLFLKQFYLFIHVFVYLQRAESF